MVSSGCPILNKLCPIGRHHLPFANSHEAMYRALSMNVLAQYLRVQSGLTPDWAFAGRGKIYQDTNLLNRDFSCRFKIKTESEATTNAITRLDCFAQMIYLTISEELLEEMEGPFQSYLKD
jgi:hypothetical protein